MHIDSACNVADAGVDYVFIFLWNPVNIRNNLLVN